MVRSTYSSFPHYKCCRWSLATSKMNFFRYNWSEKFFRKIIGNAQNRTRALQGLLSEKRERYLCAMPLPQQQFYSDCLAPAERGTEWENRNRERQFIHFVQRGHREREKKGPFVRLARCPVKTDTEKARRPRKVKVLPLTAPKPGWNC